MGPLEDNVRDALLAELKRQAANRSDLQVDITGPSAVTIDGKVDLDELIMAIIGSVAGGP